MTRQLRRHQWHRPAAIQVINATSYPLFSGHSEPKDIIPRASPSRPNSTHISPPTTPSHTSAISALRSPSIRPPSPPSPSQTYTANIWPFARSAATSPSTSYTRPASGLFSSTYDGLTMVQLVATPWPLRTWIGRSSPSAGNLLEAQKHRACHAYGGTVMVPRNSLRTIDLLSPAESSESPWTFETGWRI